LTEAEHIKKKHGCAMTSLVDSGEAIEVPSVGGRNARTVARSALTEVIEPRIEEILHLIHTEILKSGYHELVGAGVVLTGGTSLLEGIVELGEFIFEMPVRRGAPFEVSGLTEVVRTPVMATVFGLAKYGSERDVPKAAKFEDNFLGKLRKRVSDLFEAGF
jgi:cell division protein FtsA